MRLLKYGTDLELAPPLCAEGAVKPIFRVEKGLVTVLIIYQSPVLSLFFMVIQYFSEKYPRPENYFPTLIKSLCIITDILFFRENVQGNNQVLCFEMISLSNTVPLLKTIQSQLLHYRQKLHSQGQNQHQIGQRQNHFSRQICAMWQLHVTMVIRKETHHVHISGKQLLGPFTVQLLLQLIHCTCNEYI